MAINWFPGHMHKARKEIKKVMPQMDLIIEVLDARIPSAAKIRWCLPCAVTPR